MVTDYIYICLVDHIKVVTLTALGASENHLLASSTTQGRRMHFKITDFREHCEIRFPNLGPHTTHMGSHTLSNDIKSTGSRESPPRRRSELQPQKTNAIRIKTKGGHCLTTEGIHRKYHERAPDARALRVGRSDKKAYDK